jgi:hypothetical protein
MACDNCDCFDYGDVVEHKMNTDIFGVVVGFMGSLVGIQVSSSLAVLWFQEFTLGHIGDDEYHDPEGKEEPVARDNVVDFTKAKALRANTKTKGAA